MAAEPSSPPYEGQGPDSGDEDANFGAFMEERAAFSRAVIRHGYTVKTYIPSVRITLVDFVLLHHPRICYSISGYDIHNTPWTRYDEFQFWQVNEKFEFPTRGGFTVFCGRAVALEAWLTFMLPSAVVRRLVPRPTAAGDTAPDADAMVEDEAVLGSAKRRPGAWQGRTPLECFFLAMWQPDIHRLIGAFLIPPPNGPILHVAGRDVLLRRMESER